MTCIYVPTYGSEDAEVLAERTNTRQLLRLPKAAAELVEFDSGCNSQNCHLRKVNEWVS